MPNFKRLCLVALCSALSTTSAAYGEVAIIMPGWMELPDETFQALDERFGETRAYGGDPMAWRGDDALLSEIVYGTMRDEPEILIILGFGHENLTVRGERIVNALEEYGDDWSRGERIEILGDPLDESRGFNQTVDAIPLGLGFGDPRTSRDSRTVYLPMGWNVSLPVVSAAVYARGGSSPDEVAQWFYGSEEGNALRAALSIVPFEGDGAGPEITVRPWIDAFEHRYTSDDDGCGCDETETCDPDTDQSFSSPARELFEIEADAWRGVVPVPRSNDEDFNYDGCGCDARALWSEDMSRLRADAASRGLRYEMLDAMNSGQQVIVFSCDPD